MVTNLFKAGLSRNFTVSNTVNLAFSAEYLATKKFSVLGEFLVNGLGRSEAVVVPGIPPSPEAAGGELSGTLGFRYGISPKVDVPLGVSRDNAGATLFRPGLTYKFKFPKFFSAEYDVRAVVDEDLIESIVSRRRSRPVRRGEGRRSARTFLFGCEPD